ncbi:4Fe-4S ferredoxin [Limnohabitans sp. Rim8]|uniref:4Fe-4S binding protein n=1 Tax=Limnohabitans sp. Rim8 TaxID=1100718 RepID=UPI000D3B2336|nr:4Fe-4S binding protein [Limnohabitans sp. Rim8]PUE62165.1 4Fe-4S ferredoxin [Limnohabitans sp. Rim8]
MTTLICDCNQTQPLDPKALSQSLSEPLTLHTALCRREASAFVQAVQGTDDVVVACTQEQRLFGDLAVEAQAKTSVIKFVNIRETGGWSSDAKNASPKIAALLAAAHLPEPEPVPTVTFKSAGRLLILGKLDEAEQAAALLADNLNVTLFTQGAGEAGGAQNRRYPVLGGQVVRVDGWLGAFKLTWQNNNPIDLDLCTRCNACVAVCPEQAIGLDYQIDMSKCSSHRDCVTACGAVGAINFQREAQEETAEFDLVLDLREQSAFTRHALPQGYFRGATAANLLSLRELVGEFEKPKFFDYKQKLCAHSRNEKVGCNACVDICSAEAVSSDKSRQQIKVNPNLCVGCGACTTVCPTGALTYAYPRASEQGVKLKTLLSTYQKAGGKDAVILLHSQDAGQALVNELGRAAQLKVAKGLPAHVIPVSLWHTASLGLDVWLTALAYGAAQVLVLHTAEEAPQYADGLQAQMAQAQAMLEGLGYAKPGRMPVQLVHAAQALELDAELQRLTTGQQRLSTTVPAATFAVMAEKRSTLSMVIDHLLEHAPVLKIAAAPEALALPKDGSLFGSVEVNKDSCTLCMSCVSACPANALQDNQQAPQLRFFEKNCVQCGLCVSTCPEKALNLVPRLLLTPQRKEVRVLNETQPYGCVRCGKPFGTLKGIEAMIGKLAGHSMFQGEALQRLKMCGDCRVIDIYSAGDEQKIV